MASATEGITLPVAGMTCDHCVGSVRKALEGVPGVRSARVDLAAGRAEVEPEPGAELDRDRLKGAVEAAGYQVPSIAPAAEVRVIGVRGMHCGSCVAKVKAALEGVPGVRSASVDLKAERAEVEVEPGVVADSALAEALVAAGYEATSPPPAQAQPTPKLVTIGPATADRPPADLVTIGPAPQPAPPAEPEPEPGPEPESATAPSSSDQPDEWDVAIGGMHCASCVARVESALATVPGVKEARVNLATERARLVVDPATVREDQLAEAVARAGYSARRAQDDPSQGAESLRRERAGHVAYWWNRLIVGVALTIPLAILGLGPMLLPGVFGHATWIGWAMLALATPLQIYLGAPFYRGAWLRAKQLSTNMDTLIALGSTTAYGYSLYELLAGSAHMAHFFMEVVCIAFAVIVSYLLLRYYS